MSANLIKIGVITGAHGIRGAVKIQSFTAVPGAIATYGTLQGADGRTIDILRMKPAKDVFIADLKGVTDRNAAELLRGTELFVARSKLPPPTEGEIYLHDLLGKSVINGGVKIGVVSGFQNYGAGDLMELEDGLLIPLAFLEADDAGGTGDSISVTLPDGFLAPDDTPAGQGGRP